MKLPVSVSKATLDLIHAHAMGPIDPSSWRPTEDGRCEIDVDPEVLACLAAIDADVDTAITRLFTRHVGHA